MGQEESPQERAQRAQLTRHPHDHSACGGCIFYAPRTDAKGYCAEPMVQLDVMANWWCKYHQVDESQAKLTGHPLHPALIPFPIALTIMALIFDILAGTKGDGKWRRSAKHSLVAGTIGGLLAAPSGTMDWLSLPTQRPAKIYGLIHGVGNLLLLGINGLNIALRNGDKAPSPARRAGEIGLSTLATAMVLITGWLGGQLAYRFGVGVETPTRPYRILDIEPIVRLWNLPQWRNGALHMPAQPVWSGPAIPSQPLPPEAEQRLAAS
jgi:uncharacterized membrane protein